MPAEDTAAMLDALAQAIGHVSGAHMALMGANRCATSVEHLLVMDLIAMNAGLHARLLAMSSAIEATRRPATQATN